MRKGCWLPSPSAGIRVNRACGGARCSVESLANCGRETSNISSCCPVRWDCISNVRLLGWNECTSKSCHDSHGGQRRPSAYFNSFDTCNVNLNQDMPSDSRYCTFHITWQTSATADDVLHTIEIHYGNSHSIPKKPLCIESSARTRTSCHFNVYVCIPPNRS